MVQIENLLTAQNRETLSIWKSMALVTILFFFVFCLIDSKFKFLVGCQFLFSVSVCLSKKCFACSSKTVWFSRGQADFEYSLRVNSINVFFIECLVFDDLIEEIIYRNWIVHQNESDKLTKLWHDLNFWQWLQPLLWFWWFHWNTVGVNCISNVMIEFIIRNELLMN